MPKSRLEAFSVLAIIITIMVLEFKVPAGPISLSLFHATRRVTAAVLWSNLHLLFWLSLPSFATAWMGQNQFAPLPTARYGVVLLLAGTAYFTLPQAILADQGPDFSLALALGRDWKGKLSLLIYVAAIPLAFVNPRISNALYIVVALWWVVPDRRIEQALAQR